MIPLFAYYGHNAIIVIEVQEVGDAHNPITDHLYSVGYKVGEGKLNSSTKTITGVILKER